MKIIHICLACFYIEGYGYQENILPQFHKMMGNDVTVIATEYTYNKKFKKIPREKLDYVNEYGINVKTVKFSKIKKISSKFGLFKGLYKLIENENPNIIFVHGGQFLSLKDVIKYCKKNKSCKLFIDQHGDFYNTKVNTLKSKLMQYLIYGHYMRKAVNYVEKFWGVTPWRCEFLNKVYKIPQSKIDLLIMGGDDRFIDFENKEIIKSNIRQLYNIKNSDFLIVSGGKIDERKNIHLLIEACKQINRADIKLLIFGSIVDSMNEKIKNLIDGISVINVGWVSSNDVYNYFLAADLGVFPGTHSVLWEQACSTGLPCIFKYWEGMTHVNVSENADFLYNDSVDEIKNKIMDLYNSKEKYEIIKKNASQIAVNSFLYSKIAARSILVD